MGLQIWLPPSARDTGSRRVLVCQVPGCGRRFPESQRSRFEHHVSDCGRRNMDAIQEQAAIRESDPFTSVGDKEQYGWVRKLASKVGPTEANKRLRGKKGR